MIDEKKIEEAANENIKPCHDISKAKKAYKTIINNILKKGGK